jgi:hypothetical protein
MHFIQGVKLQVPFSGGESQNRNPADARPVAEASRDAWLGGER